MPGPAYEIPWNIGEGGSNLSDDGIKGLVRALRSIKEDLDTVKASFDDHQHRVDGSALSAATDITGIPVTGTATGTPTGGTPIDPIAVGTTLEDGFDEHLHIGK
jgi:hypothetical protein